MLLRNMIRKKTESFCAWEEYLRQNSICPRLEGETYEAESEYGKSL